MKKTKEIDVWISESIAKYPHGHRFESLYLGTTAPHGYGYKAKLIIELPEQKIEITKSELDSLASALRSEYLKCRGCEHFKNVGNCDGCNNSTAETTYLYQKRKKELGF